MKIRTFHALLWLTMACCLAMFSCKKSSTDDSNQLGAHPNDNDRTLPYTNADWMAGIDNTRYLSELAIPGTHDAGADLHSSEQGVEQDYTIAQDFRISNQLMLGVRWFDIRLSDDGGTMTVFHGPYYLHKNFTDLIQEAIDFLNDHPTETVIYCIKQEHSSRGDDAFANGIWCGYLNPHLDHFWLGNHIPMLGEVRGKIVIMRQYEGTHGYPMGSPLTWQDNETGNIYMSDGNFYYYVQDHYSLMTVETSTKISQIEACLNMANREPYPYRCFYINYTSGERQLTQTLEHISSEINPAINDFLNSGSWRNVGVVMMNFAGGSDDGSVPNDLAKTVVGLNNFSNELKIGSQTWMNHNLDVVKYSNGDAIPNVQDMSQWAKLTTGAYCTYENGSGGFGMLYNYYAVTDPRGLAPGGWHIPSLAEWNTLAASVGGVTIAAGNLKDAGTQHWESPNTGGMNSVLFTALPGGARWQGGNFGSLGETAFFWTSTAASSSTASLVWMNFDNPQIYFPAYPLTCGFSVRCVKNN